MAEKFLKIKDSKGATNVVPESVFANLQKRKGDDERYEIVEDYIHPDIHDMNLKDKSTMPGKAQAKKKPAHKKAK